MPNSKPAPKTECGLFRAVHRAVKDLTPSVIHRSSHFPPDLSGPGAYLLVCPIPRAIKTDISPLSLTGIPAGSYIYAGSAYGPGGMAARITRHFKRRKKVHWHIDHVTRIYPPPQALAFPHARECELVSVLIDRLNAASPIKGFGSSDCPRCYAHLLQLPC